MRFATMGVFMLTMTAFIPAKGGEPAFSRGLPTSPDFFPIAVWLQSPTNAQKYKDVGINVYVGLWRGPTEEQLDTLDAAGMKLFSGQGKAALKFKDRPTIVGWLQDDEPDNAQARRGGEGYGPPVTPEAVLKRYKEMQAADPTRPVMLNLGQGVAWDGWYGRGVRTNHPEDYPEYVKAGDIVSFDIYPACATDKAVAGKLEYVPQGVDRLKKWTGEKKPVWCCIETTGINNPKRKPTPAEVRAEVWMALIHGANGILYFAHQFKPTFIEAGLLADESITREVAAVNRRITSPAHVLNSPDVPDGATVSSSNKDVPISVMVKRRDGATYVFAVSLRDGETTATFQLADKADAKVEVLDEDRALDAKAGGWTDRFSGYQAHLYRIR